MFLAQPDMSVWKRVVALKNNFILSSTEKLMCVCVGKNNPIDV